MKVCTDYKPDHNGECTNCDEAADMHLPFLNRYTLLRGGGWIADPDGEMVSHGDYITAVGALMQAYEDYIEQLEIENGNHLDYIARLDGQIGKA